MYIKSENENLLIFVVYVDDIIFSNDASLPSQKFAMDMQAKFEMFMLGEITFF